MVKQTKTLRIKILTSGGILVGKGGEVSVQTLLETLWNRQRHSRAVNDEYIVHHCLSHLLSDPFVQHPDDTRSLAVGYGVKYLFHLRRWPHWNLYTKVDN